MKTSSSMSVTWRLSLCAALACAVGACSPLRERAKPTEDLTPSRTKSVGELVSDALASESHMAEAQSAIALREGGCALARVEIVERLRTGNEISDETLARSLELMSKCPASEAPAVFEALVSRPHYRDRAWMLAASHPSNAMAKVLAEHLSKAMVAPETNLILTSSLADALRINKVPGSYTLLRQGLGTPDAFAFARAMTALEPSLASDDLLTYLAKVDHGANGKTAEAPARPILRAIFHALVANPPSLRHPNLDQLFHYASSTDGDVAKAARDVVSGLVEIDRIATVEALSALGEGEQVDFLNHTATDESPGMQTLRDDLKSKTLHAQVRRLLLP